MHVKMVEIRDRGTFIPAMATLLGSAHELERYLFARAGYGIDQVHQAGYVLLTKLVGGDTETHDDPFKWSRQSRTMHEAHKFLLKHWYEVKSGDVVDVEFVTGETKSVKRSEYHVDHPRCPTCDSPDPFKHPAVQYEGEVQECRDAWHRVNKP